VLVPALLRMLLDHVRALNSCLPELTLWISSGEALDPELAMRFKQSMSHATLINMYGCTEASDDVTWYEVQDSAGLTRVPIGKPISNVRVYVLDQRLQPVPIGVTGEVCVAGAGIAREYLNRPELTAQKFLPDPFGPASSRLYRTGDRARWLPDGNLEFVGRLDQQVKVRGVRVELAEVETALSRHPNVKQAVVTGCAGDGGARLVAFVMPHRLPAPTYEELRAFLMHRLPDYMLPVENVVLDALPLTPSGKIDRGALPEPARRSEISHHFVEPRTEVELTLARIWSDLLRVQRVGVEDNFFELGGESILALQMIARATEAGVRLTLKDLFQRQTIAGLAVLADGMGGDSDTLRVPHPLLVPLGTAVGGPPIFCIHPVEGTVWAFADLARLLETDQPLYGIRAQGLAAKESPLATIEEMAVEYLSAVHALQRAGPYFLCGWSMGGLIAYEMARRLQQGHEAVAFLAILDQGASRFANPSPGSPIAEPVEALRIRLESLPDDVSDEQIAELRTEPGLVQLLPPILEEAEVSQYLRLYIQNWLALRRYAPIPSSLHIDLFRRVEFESADTDATLGWSTVVGGNVSVHSVAGDHRSMMRAPYVSVLARQLRACLNRIRARTSQARTSEPRPSLASGGRRHGSAHTIASPARTRISDVRDGRVGG